MERINENFLDNIVKVSNMYKTEQELKKITTEVEDIVYKINSRYKRIQNKYNIFPRHFQAFGLDKAFIIRENWDYFIVEQIKEEMIMVHIYYEEDIYNNASDWIILVGLTDKKQKELFRTFDGQCKSIKDKTSPIDELKIKEEIDKLEKELAIKRSKLDILKTEAS